MLMALVLITLIINFTVICQRQADIVIVLDASSSIGSENWLLMLNFVTNLIQKLTVSEQGIHVGVVTFADNCRVEFLLDEFYTKSVLLSKIKQISYSGGNTNTSCGIMKMRTDVFDITGSGLRGDRAIVPNLAIVITDGGSNFNSGKTIPFANDAKDADIQMLAIGISNSVNETELRGISSDGILNSTYWRAPDFNITDKIIGDIITQTCNIIPPGNIIIQISSTVFLTLEGIVYESVYC